MFSQKSSRLINLLYREKQRDTKVTYYKVSLTAKLVTEYPIITHDGVAFNGPGFLIPPDFDFAQHVKNLAATAIAIDEFQFLSDDWHTLLRKLTDLANEGRRLFLAGLDKDYQGQPFDKVAFAACEADIVEKTTAICFRCSADATHTYKYAGSQKRLEEGGEDKYRPVCRYCFRQLKENN
jgi:thymidine kinase